MKYSLSLSAILLASLTLQCAPPLGGDDEPKHLLTTVERSALIRRAQVWKATDVAAMDLKAGPRMKGAFAPGETVVCTYVKARFSGNTPKFACAITPQDKVKVRYGRDNGEIYAGVAATRLLWALGFGANVLYPVNVVCRGCPAAVAAEGDAEGANVRFALAAIERKMPGEELEAWGVGPGWWWAELDRVDEQAGGAPLAQRDALKLLAAFLQHTDNKAEQQRLVCLDPVSEDDSAGCRAPLMMIHDVGLTFGRANRLNRNAPGSTNLDQWANTAIWRDQARCVANLAPSHTGTLEHPSISESGRRFLADLLARLTDDQLRDLFEVARFGDRALPGATGGSPVALWVQAFKHKRDDITGTTCP